MTKTIIEKIRKSTVSPKSEPELIIEINRHHQNPNTKSGIENIKLYRRNHPYTNSKYITYEFSGFDLQYLSNAKQERNTASIMKKVFTQHPHKFTNWKLINSGFVMQYKTTKQNDEQAAHMLNQFYDYFNDIKSKKGI